MSWKLMVREGSRVKRSRIEGLDQALDVLERRAHELQRSASRDPVDLKYKEFAPARLVAARLELAGPQRLLPDVQAGIDIRGDGSMEAYRGRVRRTLIEPRDGEGAIEALRRELTATGPAKRR